MNFTTVKGTRMAMSECGLYRIDSALNNGKPWYNATYLPTLRGIEGSYDKELCKATCVKHAARMVEQKAMQR